MEMCERGERGDEWWLGWLLGSGCMCQFFSLCDGGCSGYLLTSVSNPGMNPSVFKSGNTFAIQDTTSHNAADETSSRHMRRLKSGPVLKAKSCNAHISCEAVWESVCCFGESNTRGNLLLRLEPLCSSSLYAFV